MGRVPKQQPWGVTGVGGLSNDMGYVPSSAIPFSVGLDVPADLFGKRLES